MHAWASTPQIRPIIDVSLPGTQGPQSSPHRPVLICLAFAAVVSMVQVLEQLQSIEVKIFHFDRGAWSRSPFDLCHDHIALRV